MFGGWYLIAHGKAYGPVSRDKLLAYLAARNPAQVQIWREGFETRRLANDVKEWDGEAEQASSGAGIGSADSATSRPQRSRKFRWGRAGAILGPGLGVLLLVISARYASPFFTLNFLLGTTALSAFFCFVAGALADLSKPPGWTTARTPPLPASIKKWRNRRLSLARHWRGELPLWVSYWVVNVATAGFAVLLAFVFTLSKQSDYDPIRVFFTYTGILACSVVLVSWHLTGLWRSAQNYRFLRSALGRSGFWGYAAQAMVLLGVVSSFAAFLTSEAPAIRTVWRIAFQNDPDIPNYSIRVMRDGTEAEISGGLKFGVSNDFVKILAASPNIKVVHLNSVGGRVGEGKRLYELIRSNRLTTYVSHQCLSACTMAFAGGQERLLREDAVLGFHKGAFPGLKDSDFDSVQRDVFLGAGFDKGFVDKALATPNADIYMPGPTTLLVARVITGMPDNNRFAISGFGNVLSKHQMSAALMKSLPSYATLKEKFPLTLDALAKEFYQNVLKGKTEAETQSSLRIKLHPFVKNMIPLADDHVLVGYARLVSDQFEDLSKKSVKVCYDHASQGSQEAFSLLSAELLLRETNLYEQVLRSAEARAFADPKLFGKLWAKVGIRLRAHVSEADMALLSSSTVQQSDYARYCDVAVKMFREIASLPQQEGATILRNILQ